MLKADAVFEGGGVKGIGLAGAVSVISEKYHFENLAGTSAGGIVAALLAVGYSSAELKNILNTLNYNSFKDEGVLDKLGVIGKGLSIGFEYGIYEGNFFENWLDKLLQAKGITTFGQLKTGYPEEKYQYKLQLIAADLTTQRILVLPHALRSFGIDPDSFRISKAVRMSMSIPIFFEPVKLEDTTGKVHLIVDGAVLSNYPIWLLDDGTSNPPWPTFGFKFMKPVQRSLKHGQGSSIDNPVAYFKALAATMMDAHDNHYISKSKGDFARTIGVTTAINLTGKAKQVGVTDFDITRDESEALYANGVQAAEKFLATWDFAAWKQKYRHNP